jgi:hypothetical protein
MSLFHNPKLSTEGLAFCFDSGNQRSYSPNAFQFSTDIFSWTTSASRAVLSRDTIASPVGNKPLKMVPTGNDPFTNLYNVPAGNITPVNNGETWTLSVYVKANRPTTVELFLFGANSSGTGFVDGSWIGISSQGFSIGTEWTRISRSITYNNPDVAFLHFRLDGTPVLDSGVEIWWDGVQVEKGSSATPFNKTSSQNSIKNLTKETESGTIVSDPTFSFSDGRSLVFDGVDDRINFGNNPSVNFGTGSFSVSCWFKRSTSAVSNARLLSKGANGDSAPDAGFCFFGSNVALNFAVNPSGTRTILAGLNYSVGEWVNAVGVVDRSSQVRFYKNGNLISSASSPTGSATGGINFIVGAGGNGTSLWWPGNIAHVMLHEVALSDTQVKENFNALKGRFGL